MCLHELWPTSVSHPFAFLNSYSGGKHDQEIRLVLQNFALPDFFPYYLCYPISSPYFLLVVLFYLSIFQYLNRSRH